MVNLNRKITILMHIKKYCYEILDNFKFFGTQYETFDNNNIFRDSISMKLFQIGELVKELYRTEKDFIIETKNKVLWKDIIKMRERFAHHYGEMNYEIVFYTALEDIPKLINFIEEEI